MSILGQNGPKLAQNRPSWVPCTDTAFLPHICEISVKNWSRRTTLEFLRQFVTPSSSTAWSIMGISSPFIDRLLVGVVKAVRRNFFLGGGGGKIIYNIREKTQARVWEPRSHTRELFAFLRLNLDDLVHT